MCIPSDFDHSWLNSNLHAKDSRELKYKLQNNFSLGSLHQFLCYLLFQLHLQLHLVCCHVLHRWRRWLWPSVFPKFQMRMVLLPKPPEPSFSFTSRFLLPILFLRQPIIVQPDKPIQQAAFHLRREWQLPRKILRQELRWSPKSTPNVKKHELFCLNFVLSGLFANRSQKWEGPSRFRAFRTLGALDWEHRGKSGFCV